MSGMDKDFEKYFQAILKEEHEILKTLPYTEEQLREIYYQPYEYEKEAPELQLKMESQPLDHHTVQYYLPEKWEMPRKGKLLYSDRELQRVLKLIIFNLGIEKTLEMIPPEAITQYLNSRS